MAIITGLSGNEIFCLRRKGFKAGNVVLGNSVYSLGFVGSFGAGLNSMLGGEVSQVTDIIHEGRQQAYERLVADAQRHGAQGVTGVTNALRHFHGNIEYLSAGSAIHTDAGGGLQFTTSGDAQDLYCQLDAGYAPVQFVFSNIAYSVGIAGGLLGGLKSMRRGEIREFSDVFNATRHHALYRLKRQAQMVGATAVLGINVCIGPFQGVHEMLMTGTAARHALLPDNGTDPVTSDLTGPELWNMTAMGYAPVQMVMGTAVYSLGISGSVSSLLKSFVRGEINELTSLIYEAREHALDLINREADALGAEEIVGVKTFINHFGESGLLEVLAVGTAVRKRDGVGTQTETLPAQAIVADQDTWIGG